MFVDEAAELDVAYPLARARLLRLAAGGWFLDASDRAYADGLAGLDRLLRVGPFGDVPGASKLVRVLLLDAVDRDDGTSLPLRWEATGVMGRMFPVLDANLTLARAGEDASRLALNGAYRPPLAGLGASLDRVLLHRAASATVRSLVRRLAGGLSVPGPAAGPVATGEAAREPAGTRPAVVTGPVNGQPEFTE